MREYLIIGALLLLAAVFIFVGAELAQSIGAVSGAGTAAYDKTAATLEGSGIFGSGTKEHSLTGDRLPSSGNGVIDAITYPTRAIGGFLGFGPDGWIGSQFSEGASP